MELTGAEIIVECLIREGVECIFGIPGGVNLPLFDKLYDSKIRVILTRHEQGATHMADGYARSTGKVGVCVATSGPGATNLTTGLATANMDSAPVIAISGQVATHLIGNDAFQEVDATGVTRSVTKHNYLVKDVKELAKVIREAFFIASTGRPGPVHIDVPVDVQRAKTEFIWPEEAHIRSYRPNYDGHPLQIKRAAAMISKAERPLLYVGGGVITSNAAGDIVALAEKGDIPVAFTLMANGVIPHDHNLFIGPLGMHGKYSANMAMQNCDVMICCGARFDDRVTGSLSTFAPNSKKIHIDIDPASIGKNVQVDVPVVGDLKRILPELTNSLDQGKHTSWKEQIRKWEETHPLPFKDDGSLKPQFILNTLHKLTNGEAIVSTGVGQHQMWSMQWYPPRHPRHFITSGGLGTMGFGFPAALGAKVGNPDKTVVCIDGDGSFQMTMTEMATAVYEKINVVVIVFNNYFLGMVRQWQELFYKERFSGSCLAAPGGKMSKEKAQEGVQNLTYWPNFSKWAEAYGIKAYRVVSKNELEPTLKQALNINGPVIVECLIQPKDKVFPMVPAGGGLDDIIVDMA